MNSLARTEKKIDKSGTIFHFCYLPLCVYTKDQLLIRFIAELDLIKVPYHAAADKLLVE